MTPPILTKQPYLAFLAAVIGLGLLLIGGFNRLMNPYDTFLHIPVDGLNTHRNFGEQLRLRRPIQIYQRTPEILIAGGSRSGRGFRCQNITPTPDKCYNASIQGITNQETYRLLEHALANGHLKEVWWELNFYSFISEEAYRAGFNDELYAKEGEGMTFSIYKSIYSHYFFSLFSLQALQDSLRSFKFQHKSYGWFSTDLTYMDKDGSWGAHTGSDALSDPTRYHKKNSRTWNFVLKKIKRLFQESKIALDNNPSLLENNLQIFSKIISLMYRNNIQLNIVLSTSHVQLTRLQWDTGLGNPSDTWKRKMVEINNSLAKQYNQRPFPIYDILEITPYTTEPTWNELPQDEFMRWFVDPTHFNELLGGKLLAAIINSPQTSELHREINASNINTHLDEMNKMRIHYLNTHKIP